MTPLLAAEWEARPTDVVSGDPVAGERVRSRPQGEIAVSVPR